VEPHHLAAERDGLGEQGGVCRERHAQAGPHQVLLEARREGGMRQDGGDVGHHVLGGDLSAVGLR
jgi:hypothetical protein